LRMAASSSITRIFAMKERAVKWWILIAGLFPDM